MLMKKLENPRKSIKRDISLLFLASLGILGFLLWLIYYRTPTKEMIPWVSHLSLLNSILNLTTACLLIAGRRAIKQGRTQTHIKLMLSAVSLSLCFLVSYIIYHYYHGETRFLREDFIRYFYFALLISHLILAACLVPLILSTLYFAAAKNFSFHLKVARITFPVWLYVAVTGVMIYIMLTFFNVI